MKNDISKHYSSSNWAFLERRVFHTTHKGCLWLGSIACSDVACRVWPYVLLYEKLLVTRSRLCWEMLFFLLRTLKWDWRTWGKHNLRSCAETSNSRWVLSCEGNKGWKQVSLNVTEGRRDQLESTFSYTSTLEPDGSFLWAKGWMTVPQPLEKEWNVSFFDPIDWLSSCLDLSLVCPKEVPC